MFHFKKRVAAVGATLAIATVGLVGLTAPSASAYGTDHLYQVTLSYNCMNKTLCASTPFGIGGIWGWLEPDAGPGQVPGFGDADGQLQFQGHSNANPALNGPGHSTAILGWKELDCSVSSPPADCALVVIEGVPTDPNGHYFEFLVNFGALGVTPVLTPATEGQYNEHPAAGVSAIATVTEMH